MNIFKKVFFFIAILFSIAFFSNHVNAAAADGVVPGTTKGNSVITCGRAGQPMCTLCDILGGMNNIVRYGWYISVFIAITMFTIGAIMYIISAGDNGLITQGKGYMKDAAIGFVIVLSAWLLVNTVMIILGARPDLKTGWSKFNCAPAQTQVR